MDYCLAIAVLLAAVVVGVAIVVRETIRSRRPEGAARVEERLAWLESEVALLRRWAAARGAAGGPAGRTQAVPVAPGTPARSMAVASATAEAAAGAKPPAAEGVSSDGGEAWSGADAAAGGGAGAAGAAFAGGVGAVGAAGVQPAAGEDAQAGGAGGAGGVGASLEDATAAGSPAVPIAAGAGSGLARGEQGAGGEETEPIGAALGSGGAPGAGEAAGWDSVPAVVSAEPGVGGTTASLASPDAEASSAAGDAAAAGGPFTAAAPAAAAGADATPPATPPSPPPRRPSLEERIGARLPVWIGSIALALAGAFLVKYSLDQGWIGPRVRVLLAIAFAAALIAAGERLRRSSASIAQGTTAAGVAVLYAALLAAVHLYGLIGPWAGFLLLAATTAAAVGLALRHGRMVALIGLLGGLATPHLVVLDDPRPGHLFVYLLLLEAGLLAVSRRRGWTGVALASLAGGFGWTVLAVAGVLGAGSSRGAAIFLLGSAALAALTGARGEAGRWRGPQAVVSGAGLGGALVLLLALVARRGYATEEWAFLGLLVAGLLVLARIEERFFPLAAVAAAGVGLLLLAWLAALEPGELTRFLATLAALSALVAGGAYGALWRSPRPGRWGLLAAVVLGVAPLFAFAAGDAAERALPESWVCLGAAALAALGAWPPLRARLRREDYAAAADALAVAAAALVALASWYGLEAGGLTVAWALEVPLIVELSRRWRLPTLWTPAVPLALLSAGRLILMPGEHFPAGGWPVANRLLVDYGVPALAFAVAAWRARRAAEGEVGRLPRLARPLSAAAVVLLFLLVTLEVRHAFHPGELWAPVEGLTESGWWLVGWLGLAWALAAAGRRLPGATSAAVAVLAIALGGGLVLHGSEFNPLVVHRPVGDWPVLNLLLWGYGAPLLLLVAIDRELRRQGRARAALAARVGALVAGFLLVGLEVRRAFHGTYLDGGGVTFAEWGALVSAWAALALVLELADRRWPGRELDIAGRAIAAVAGLALLCGPLTLANPLLRPTAVGWWPVLNLLLWTYGAPALLFAALARAWTRRGGEGQSAGLPFDAELSWWTSAVCGVTLLTVEVRHPFHRLALHEASVRFAEWGALIAAWLVAAALARVAARRFVRPARELSRLADALVVLALVGLVVGPLNAANPAWSHHAVGALPVVNLLLWTYGVPALLLALHARLLRRDGRPAFARWTGGVALLLAFVLVTLEVRQAFRGSFLDGGGAGHGEQYAYSAAWVLFATGLLAAAVTLWRSRALRLASLAVMALAVGKVFLYDTAHLTDLYRVLSFLGLGLSLLLLAWLYQRFVFRDGGGGPPAAAATDG